jgi:hypothetical protein
MHPSGQFEGTRSRDAEEFVQSLSMVAAAIDLPYLQRW